MKVSLGIYIDFKQVEGRELWEDWDFFYGETSSEAPAVIIKRMHFLQIDLLNSQQALLKILTNV